ncbi:hypothetical protein ATANTOWER_024801, partial [Ataeniobius toweri]|nr:hypothetical protein [Ataeniobius toweri]
FLSVLFRIQSGYSALQRINQDLEDKMCRTNIPCKAGKMVACENHSESSVSEILRTACLAPASTACSKSLKSPFFLILL